MNELRSLTPSPVQSDLSTTAVIRSEVEKKHDLTREEVLRGLGARAIPTEIRKDPLKIKARVCVIYSALAITVSAMTAMYGLANSESNKGVTLFFLGCVGLCISSTCFSLCDKVIDLYTERNPNDEWDLNKVQRELERVLPFKDRTIVPYAINQVMKTFFVKRELR